MRQRARVAGRSPPSVWTDFRRGLASPASPASRRGPSPRSGPGSWPARCAHRAGY